MKRSLHHTALFTVFSFVVSLLIEGCRIVAPSVMADPSPMITGNVPVVETSRAITNTVVLPSNTLIPTDTSKPSPSPIPSQTPKPTLMPTPEPTLTIEESKALVLELLQTNGNCELPCWWGIVPQQSSIQEVKKLVNHLGWKWIYFRDTIRDNLTTGSGILYDAFGLDVSFEDKSDLVGSINLQIGYGKRIPTAPYTIKEILNTIGIPEQIRLDLVYVPGFEVARPTTGYKIWVFYDKQGIMLRYSGTAIKVGSAYRICPTDLNLGGIDKEGSGNVSLILKSSDDVRSLSEIGEIHGDPIGGTLSIFDASGMSVDEFYDQLMAREYGPYCFETPISAWP
jgi:hypothetical protein